MPIKNITYKRTLNLGNYENKFLELFADVPEGGDEELEITRLMILVERKLRERIGQEFQKEILTLEAQRNTLSDEVYSLRQELKELGQIKDFYDQRKKLSAEIFSLKQELRELGKIKDEPQKEESTGEEPDIDEIPFESGDIATQSGIPEGF